MGTPNEMMKRLLEHGAQKHLTRRRFVQFTGVLAGTTMLGSLLAGCEADDDADDEAPAVEPDDDEEEPDVDDEELDVDEDDDEETDVDDDDRYGGTFIAANESPPPTLDVMTSTTAASREATWFSQDTLVTYGEEYEMIPLLAESWEIDEDDLTMTFHLREGMPFHNGDELNADDVVASLDRFLEVSPRVDEFDALDSYEAVDDYTFVCQLSQGGTGVLDAIALPYACLVIFPREVIEGKGPDELEVEDIIGTGPYILTEWQPDQHLIYERFEDYEPLDEPRDGLGGGKVPYFDEIRLLAVPETSSRVAGLETGEYHFTASPPSTDFEHLDEHEEIDVHILEELRWQVILFNHNNPITGNLAFRRAIQAAADMEQMAMAVTAGNPDFFQLQPSMWFPSTPWHNEEGADLYNQADFDLAQEYLEEAGYDGEEIILVTNRNFDYMFSAIIALEEQLREGLGMNVTTEVVDWPAQQSRWEEDDWHISTTGYLSQAIFAPGAFAGFYGGGGASAGAGYENPDMTAAFERGAAAVEEEEKQEAYREVQRIFHEDVAGLKVADLFGFTATRREVQDFAPWYNMTRFWGCWLDE